MARFRTIRELKQHHEQQHDRGLINAITFERTLILVFRNLFPAVVVVVA